MIVWELKKCGRVWMQESRGLFATKDLAINTIPNVQLAAQRDPMLIVGRNNDAPILDRLPSIVWLPIPGHIIIKEGNIWQFIEEETNTYSLTYDDLPYLGYHVWGIFSRRVIE